MILAAGAVILLLAVTLLGVAVLLPSTPEVPLDRRRPFEAEPPSSISRLALSGVRSFERLLEGRNVRLFSRNFGRSPVGMRPPRALPWWSKPAEWS